jgi:hypothetical protein
LVAVALFFGVVEATFIVRESVIVKLL